MSHPAYIGKELTILVDSTKLRADYYCPQNSKALIVFAQADLTNGQRVLQRTTALKVMQDGFAVLGVNLLTETERRKNCELILDSAAQGDRLAKVLDWLGKNEEILSKPLFLFGTGSAGGACLVAGSLRRNKISAIAVLNSKGSSRPESYDDALSPTLFMINESCSDVLEHNRQIAEAIVTTAKEIEVLQNSTSNGEIDRANVVATLTRTWFTSYLPTSSAPDNGTLHPCPTVKTSR